MGKKSRRKNETTSNTDMENNDESIEKLLDQAETAMDTSEINLALGLYNAAAEALRPMIGNADEADEDGHSSKVLLLAQILGKTGEARASLGDLEGGRRDFLEGISILTSAEGSEQNMDVENGNGCNSDLHDVLASLYLYLGQMNEGQEALDSYRSGIKHLESSLALQPKEEANEAMIEEDGDESPAIEIRKQLCGAYCSVAELYLTDLCYEPNAESECESSLNQALKHDVGPTPDALQALANLRLSQSRGQEATDAMMKAWDRMKSGCGTMAALVGLGPEEENDDCESEAKELTNVDDLGDRPGFEFRVQSAKILLECSSFLASQDLPSVEESNNCAEAAIQVLGSLLAENDEVVEIWFLVGCAFASQQPKNSEMAIHHWERAMEMLLKVEEDLEQEMEEAGPDDEACLLEQLEGVKDQMEMVKEKLKGVNAEEMDNGL